MRLIHIRILLYIKNISFIFIIDPVYEKRKKLLEENCKKNKNFVHKKQLYWRLRNIFWKSKLFTYSELFIGLLLCLENMEKHKNKELMIFWYKCHNLIFWSIEKYVSVYCGYYFIIRGSYLYKRTKWRTYQIIENLLSSTMKYHSSNFLYSFCQSLWKLR